MKTEHYLAARPKDRIYFLQTKRKVYNINVRKYITQDNTRIVFITMILFGMFLGAHTAHAQKPTSANLSFYSRAVQLFGEWKYELSAAVNETKISVAEKRRDIKTAARGRLNELKTYIDNRVSDNNLSRVKKVNEGAIKDIKRLRAVTIRLENRLNALAKKGKNIDSAKILLEEAKQQIAEVERTAEITKESLGATIETGAQKVIGEKITDETQAIRKKIKFAHQTLVRVINEVK